MREFFNKVTTFFLAGLCLAFLFSSCDSLFDVEVKEFFKEYTETAAIDSCDFDSSFLVNASGIKCFDSYDQKSVTFKLRNPQNYALKLSYEFDDSAAKTDNEANPYTLVLGASRDTATLTFSQAFLKDRDCGTKNISGKVTIFEPNSGRYFESYPLSINADSAPPAVENACFQLSSADNGTYIICFHLPDVSNFDIHKNDTKKIYFNGSLRYFKGGFIYKNYPEEGMITTPDQDFEYAPPAGMTTSESGYDFTATTCPTGYSVVYYKSGIPQSTNTVPMEISIVDDSGLTSTVAISNKAEQLSAPYISNIAELASGVLVDEESGLYNVVISHNGLTATSKSCGTVSISYEVYDIGGTFVKSGTASGSAKVSLSKGRYKIKAKASKPYYISSESYDSSATGLADGTNGIWLKAPAIFYVSQNGSNTEGTGSKASPYRTIQKAVDDFAVGVTNGDYDSSTECVIRVMSDLIPDESDTFGGTENSLINLKNQNSYSIEGYNGQFTIDAQKKGRIIYSSDSTNVELKNLVLKGGSSLAQGAAVYIKATVLGTLNIDSCTITENEGTGTNCNGGIIYTGRSLKIQNSYVSYNQLTKSCANARGMLVYANHSYSIVNSVIKDNKIQIEGNSPTSVTISGALFMSDQSAASSISDSKIINNEIIAANVTSQNNIMGLIYYSDNMGASLKIENSEISGNRTSLSNTGTLQGTVFAGSQKQTTLKGKNTIYNNIYTVDGVDTQCNVYVTKGNPLVIGGDLSGKIGVTTSVAPEVGKTITFTKDYSNYSVSGAVFVSDNSNYGIAKDGNEMALALGGGAIGDVIKNQTMNFVCEEYEELVSPKIIKFYPGIRKEIVIVPYLELNDAEVETDDDRWDSVTWTTWLTCDGAEVPDTRKNGTGYSMKGVIPESVVYEENYMLYVKATVNGVSYDASWPLRGVKDIVYASNAPEAFGTYNITSSTGLTKLKNWVAAGSVASSGFVFELSNDIIVETGFGNIGTSARPFKAVFDGKGYTISGLNITSGTGLFAYIQNATIQNLTVDGTITSPATYVGGIVGQSTSSTIKNCKNKAQITSSNDSGAAAGIVGSCVNSKASILDGCINEGTISSKKFAAGIIASGGVDTTIRNCTNKGSITSISSGYTGGIEPQQYAKIYNCCNLGEITGYSSNGYIGGITGNPSYGNILTNCLSYALIYNMTSGTGGNIGGAGSLNNESVNYFSYPNTAHTTQALGGETGATPDYTHKFTIAGNKASTASDINVGAYTGNDVVQLLNAWIDSQENPSFYKRWKYDGSGIPVLEE